MNHSHVQLQSSPALGEVLNDPALETRRASAAPGTVIFEADDVPCSVYFIHTGQVRLYQIAPGGEQRLVEILGSGDWFGLAALAGFTRSHVRAVAVTSSVISEVDAGKLLTALRARPDALVELNRQLAAKVQSARDEADSLIYRDCNHRLIQTLLRFSRSAAAAPHENGGIVLRITHQQLAQAVGVARETVSLALTQLRHSNLVRTGRNQLFFNPHTLEEFQKKCAAGGDEMIAKQQVA